MLFFFDVNVTSVVRTSNGREHSKNEKTAIKRQIACQKYITIEFAKYYHRKND